MKELADGCAILEVPSDVNAVVKRRKGTRMAVLEPALPGLMLGFKEWGMHEHTVEQEYRTLANRHLFKTPEVNVASSGWGGLKKALRKLSKEIGYVSVASCKQIMRGRGGRAGRRMRNGLHRFYAEGVQKKHSFIKEMQKLELYELATIKVKEDRAIQFRDPRMNAALARHLSPVEHAVVNAIGDNPSGVPFMAKGRDLFDRANMLLRMAYGYRRPIFVLADHSRFDAHVSVAHLEEEHRFYLRARGYSKELKEILSWQLRNFGRTEGGILYKTVGKRMSGDLNTGLGNSVINYGLLRSWVNSGRVKADILLDGDDSIIVMEEDDYTLLPEMAAYMKELGFVTEYDTTTDVQQAEFCQSRIVYGRKGPYFCRDPKKWCQTHLISPETRGPDTSLAVLRASIAFTLTFNPAHPMLAPYVRWLKRHPGLEWVPEYWRYRMGDTAMEIARDVEYLEPTVAERRSFANAWGISPGLQEAFEREVNVLTLVPQTKEAKQRQRLPLPNPDEWEPEEGCLALNDHDLKWGSEDEGYRAYWIGQLC